MIYNDTYRRTEEKAIKHHHFTPAASLFNLKINSDLGRFDNRALAERERGAEDGGRRQAEVTSLCMQGTEARRTFESVR